jgi:hypothetical protein
MSRVGPVAAILGVVAFLALVLGVAVSALRFMLVVAAVALVIALVAAVRGRNRPDVPLTSENDPTRLR